MKIKLLTDGDYVGLEDVDFPVEVECIGNGEIFFVPFAELVRIGGDPDWFSGAETYTFLPDSEAVIVEKGK